MVEFDNYDSEKHNKDVIMELQKDPLLKEFDDKVNKKKSFLKQKQEILEEVAEKSAIENFEKGNSYYIVGFQNGAKWQQEQVKKSYSEEEVLQIIKNAFNQGERYGWDTQASIGNIDEMRSKIPFISLEKYLETFKNK